MGAARASAPPALRRGIAAGELALVTRQLASLSQSGLPLEESLAARIVNRRLEAQGGQSEDGAEDTTGEATS